MIHRSDFMMPNKHTFQIPAVERLLKRYVRQAAAWVDPFANRNHRWSKWTNDINPNADTTHNMDALDFLEFVAPGPSNVLFDPPYTLRQVKECYDGHGLALTQHESRYFYSDVKDAISRVVPPHGYVISFGYNSNGMGRARGFELVEVLLIPHGGNHHDTIVTVEKKVQHRLSEY